ncbi:alpha/beta fold hydrolase [Cyclobacterium qasimii]|uniref:Alpha/beta hydrolase n=2 Tax=Cyclobacterium qasimii TaxID=1350429 RepID=A0A512CAR8_9BACT|nr:alpha/beta hydrolase [Cyclobacterium qasimii]EPR66154.1 putative hydrolase, alpha/beta fold family [Cyclobacterium qasimii M12-11B]GEO21260.1 alpha/beta hydrolase [Cyclobacterium qasimii]
MPDISFWKEGSGKALVLLPGFCETKEMWREFAAPLLDTCEIWCPDLPGFGNSPAAKDQFSIAEIGEILADWMLANNIGDAVLIGHSLGGYLALEMALLQRLDLSGLGLFHSTAFADSEDKKKSRKKTVEFVNKHGVKSFIQSSLPLLFLRENRERCKEDIASLIHHASQLPLASIIAYLHAMRNRKDHMKTLSEFQKPTLMICGNEDTAVPIADSLKHKHAVDQFYQLTNCGHMGMFEQTQHTQKAIRTFMESLPT